MAKTVLALGMFDGMHIGHRKLIETAVRLAKGGGLTPAVFTFSTHPQELFSGEVKRLCTPEERENIMKRLGVERIEQEPFTRELASTSAESFVKLLIERMEPEIVVAGFNYTFGRGRRGDTELLSRLCGAHGVGTAVVQPVLFGKKPVSSTRVRELIEKGDVESAQLMLARAYTLGGIVIENKRIGQTIGFPTANIEPPPARAIPANGVYISMARVRGDVIPSVTNVGCSPTVGGERRTIETHIIDFDGKLYGEAIEIFFVKRLREVKTFSGLNELRAQIERDTASARDYFGCR